MKMRLFSIMVLAMFMMSCGETNTQTTNPPNTSATSTTKKPRKAVAGFATPEAIAESDVPLRGGPADIKVQIKGIQGGTGKLVGIYADQHFLADSAIINSNGEFRFQNPEGYIQGLYYVIYSGNSYVQAMLGEDQKFSLFGDLSDLDSTLKAEGSDENEAFIENIRYEATINPGLSDIAQKLQSVKNDTPEFDKLMADQQVLVDKRNAHLKDIYSRYPNTLFTSFKKAGQNPELRRDLPSEKQVYQYRQDFWEDVDFSDRRLLRTPVITNKLNRYMSELTAQSHDSIYASSARLCDRVLQYPEYYKYFTNWVLLNYDPTKTTVMDPEFVYVKMMNNYFTHDRAFWADSTQIWGFQKRASEMSQSLMGQKGPDVISKNQFGETKSIYDMKADYIVVYMFTPTCEHCQEQTPKLVTWYNEWKNKGADVYAIAIDTNDKEWKDYIKKTNMPFTTVHDPTNESIYAKYYVDVTPELYVLNPERKIIAKNLKVFQIETMINRDKEERKK